MKVFAAFFIVLCTFSNGFAGGRLSDALWERTTLSYGSGLSYYQGDIGGYVPHLKAIRYNAKLAASVRVYSFIHLHYHLSGTVLHGNDAYSNDPVFQNRGIFFATNILQGGFHLSFNNFMPLRNRRIFYYLYLGTDIGVIDVKMEKRGGSAPILPEGSYSNFQWMHPVGLGFGYMLTERIGLAYEGTLFISYTDYLDGTSYNGNVENRDTFINSNLVLSVKLGNLRRRRKPSFMIRGRRF